MQLLITLSLVAAPNYVVVGCNSWLRCHWLQLLITLSLVAAPEYVVIGCCSWVCCHWLQLLITLSLVAASDYVVVGCSFWLRCRLLQLLITVSLVTAPDYGVVGYSSWLRCHWLQLPITLSLVTAPNYVVVGYSSWLRCHSLQLLMLCFIRKAMDLMFTQRELFWLDHILPEDKRRKDEDAALTKGIDVHNDGKVRRWVFHNVYAKNILVSWQCRWYSVLHLFLNNCYPVCISINGFFVRALSWALVCGNHVVLRKEYTPYLAYIFSSTIWVASIHEIL